MEILDQYIPIQNGEDSYLKSQTQGANALIGLVFYSVRDNAVIFTQDLTDPAGENVNAVDMQLVVMDLDKYSDYDLLPLPADMAEQVVAEVVSLLSGAPPPDRRVDSFGEQEPNKR